MTDGQPNPFKVERVNSAMQKAVVGFVQECTRAGDKAVHVYIVAVVDGTVVSLGNMHPLEANRALAAILVEANRQANGPHG